MMDIIKLLRESTTSDLDAFILGEIAADTIEQLRLANTDLQMHFDYLKSEYDRIQSILRGSVYDQTPRLDDRGDNLDGN